jgi:GNAT superfamily N-acetyltransferase
VPLEPITLRPATGLDEGLFRQIYAESRRTELDQVVWPEGAREAFLRAQFTAQAAHYEQNYPGAEFFVIEYEGRPAGRFYVWRPEAEIRIMEIGLLPEFQGQGIGTALLSQLIEEGRAVGKRVTIHVEKFNPARRLYARLGFREVQDLGIYLKLEC